MPRGLICKLLTCNLGKVFSNFKIRHKLEYFWQKTHWNKMKERAQAIKKRGFFEYSLLPISFLHTSQQGICMTQNEYSTLLPQLSYCLLFIKLGDFGHAFAHYYYFCQGNFQNNACNSSLHWLVSALKNNLKFRSTG